MTREAAPKASLPMLSSSEVGKLWICAKYTNTHRTCELCGSLTSSKQSNIVRMYDYFIWSRGKWDQRERSKERCERLTFWQHLSLRTQSSLKPDSVLPFPVIEKCSSVRYLPVANYSVLIQKLERGVSDRPKLWNCLSPDREDNNGGFPISGWKVGITGIWK